MHRPLHKSPGADPAHQRRPEQKQRPNRSSNSQGQAKQPLAYHKGKQVTIMVQPVQTNSYLLYTLHCRTQDKMQNACSSGGRTCPSLIYGRENATIGIPISRSSLWNHIKHRKRQRTRLDLSRNLLVDS